MTIPEQEFVGLRPVAEWIVDQEAETAAGRALRFNLLRSGRQVWVSIGQEPDSEALRERIGDALVHGKRYVRGARIAPPYPPPTEAPA